MNTIPFETQLIGYVDQHRGRLIEIIRDLVRIPSENTPPVGAEADCQLYIADLLRKQGWEPLIYDARRLQPMSCKRLSVALFLPKAPQRMSLPTLSPASV